ncbi:hypothetical protein [Actinoplanes regularis]|uniref:Uncharacterized protein n=1 Tax=Actinoplanes regularis TaxID=52697 RepID=A0A239D1X7_9ACTN|nr:hypothetical protein [Actinoplanes regularis]GIE88454.1 hypothetical protein Are01nite_49340 [Actinoplanes regularis]SNS26209.1 hypothetical protein SAMN06264365_112213 [Actinoplanes regularis]
MTALSDRLEDLHVHASAPGGGVHGELRGASGVLIYLSTGFYRQSTERELEHRLEQLGRLLWVNRTRLYRETVEQFGDGLRIEHPDPERDPADAAFVERRALLVARGTSPDGRVTIAVEGMTTWRVTISDNTLRTLDESSFTRAVEIAAGRMIDDQAMHILQLKAQVYGEPT